MMYANYMCIFITCACIYIHVRTLCSCLFSTVYVTVQNVAKSFLFARVQYAKVSPTHKSDGRGFLLFRLINMRDPVIIGFLRGGKSLYFVVHHNFFILEIFWQGLVIQSYRQWVKWSNFRTGMSPRRYIWPSPETQQKWCNDDVMHSPNPAHMHGVFRTFIQSGVGDERCLQSGSEVGYGEWEIHTNCSGMCVYVFWMVYFSRYMWWDVRPKWKCLPTVLSKNWVAAWMQIWSDMYTYVYI